MEMNLFQFIDHIKNNPVDPKINEAQTRQYIIDGILRRLGWDLEQRIMTKPEDDAMDRKRTDYSLVDGDKPFVYIEAKRVSTKLNEEDQEQLLTNANNRGIALGVLTNGYDWQFFLPMSEVDKDKRMFEEIHIKKQDTASVEAILNRYLSREKVISGDAKKTAQEQLPKFIPGKDTDSIMTELWNTLVSDHLNDLTGMIKNLIKEKYPYISEAEISEFLKKNQKQIRITTVSKGNRVKHIVDIGNYKTIRPVALHIHGQVTKVNTINELMIELLNYVRSHDPENFSTKMMNLVGNSWSAFSAEKNDDFSIQIEGSQVYLENDIKSKKAVTSIRNVLKLFDLKDIVELEYFKK